MILEYKRSFYSLYRRSTLSIMSPSMEPTMDIEQALEKYELVINPDEPEYWSTIVDQIHEYDHRNLSYDDYAVWRRIFGNENMRFVFARCRETNQVIGSGCMVVYTDGINGPLVIGGHYFVHPEHRHKHVSTIITATALDFPPVWKYNCSANSVPNMAEKYARRFGMNKFPDYFLYIFSINKRDLVFAPAEEDDTNSQVQILAANRGDSNLLTSYLNDLTGGVDRTQYMREWIDRPGAWTKIAVNVEHDVIGLITIRRLIGNSLSVGPLYANSSSISEALLIAALQEVGDYENVLFYVPSANIEARNMIERISGGKAIEKPQLLQGYSQRTFDIPIEKIYSITDTSTSHV